MSVRFVEDPDTKGAFHVQHVCDENGCSCGSVSSMGVALWCDSWEQYMLHIDPQLPARMMLESSLCRDIANELDKLTANRET